jgi:hypothetical protein
VDDFYAVTKNVKIELPRQCFQFCAAVIESMRLHTLTSLAAAMLVVAHAGRDIRIIAVIANQHIRKQ